MSKQYSASIHRTLYDEATLIVPPQLQQAWERLDKVLWIDNADGTYTLIPAQRTIPKSWRGEGENFID